MFYRQGLKGGICKRGGKERCFWVLLRHLFVAFPSGARGKRIERKKKGNTLSFWAFFLLLLLSSVSAFVKCWEGNGWNEEEFTPEEIAAIQRGLNDIENGRTHRMLEGESFDDFIDRIAACIK